MISLNHLIYGVGIKFEFCLIFSAANTHEVSEQRKLYNGESLITSSERRQWKLT